MKASVLTFNFKRFVSKTIFACLNRIGIRPKRVFIPVLDQYLCDPCGASSTFDEIFIRKIYAPVNPLTDGCRVVDIGAHYGLFAIYVTLCFRAREIVCFEANPETFRILSENMALARNKNRAQISLYSSAVGTVSGQATLHVPAFNDTSVDSTIDPFRLVGLSPGRRTVKVPLVGIEDAVGNGCDYLKLDAEGIEYDVLRNSVFQPHKVIEIAVEFHDVNRRAKDFLSVVESLRGRGYDIFEPGGRALTLEEIGRLALHKNAYLLHFVRGDKG